MDKYGPTNIGIAAQRTEPHPSQARSPPAMALPFGAHVPFSAHNPSPLSFGFGLGVPQHHLPPPPATIDYNDIMQQFAPTPPSASTSSVGQPHSARPLLAETPHRTSEKRRRHVDEEDDAAMERSPSPADRPVRKLGVKKLRQTPLARGHSAGNLDGKAGRDGGDDVDVGSLLGERGPFIRGASLSVDDLRLD